MAFRRAVASSALTSGFLVINALFSEHNSRHLRKNGLRWRNKFGEIDPESSKLDDDFSRRDNG